MRVLIPSLALLSAAWPAFALTTAVVPEPSTLSLFAIGGAAAAFLLWRKNRNSKN